MLNPSVLKPAGLKQGTSTLLMDKKAIMIVSGAPRIEYCMINENGLLVLL